MTDTATKTPSKKTNPMVQKDIFKCVIVLVTIAVVSGLILGALNYVTYVDPEAVIMQNIATDANVALESVLKVNKDEIRNIPGSKSYVNNLYYVEVDGVKTYYYDSIGAGCKGGTMELMVKVSEGGQILDITEVKTNETAGYFKKVLKANKDKYIDNKINLNNIDVDKLFTLIKADKIPTNEFEIPGVSTATYTSTGLNNAVCAAAYDYKVRLGGAEA